MKTIRSFLAVDLGLQTARAVADFQRDLAGRCREAGARVSWVAPQNLHVTLAFLGQVTEPMVGALSSVLAPAAGAVPPFDMGCAGIGAFPDAGHPRVIWVGVSSPRGELDALHSRIAGLLRETGFPLDDKPFRSHVTIGRVREAGDGVLEGCLSTELPAGGFGSTRVGDLACYRSDLNPRGADYHVLWRLPLTGRAPTPVPQEKE